VKIEEPWIPKTGEKVEYKADTQESFWPSEIIKVESVPEDGTMLVTTKTIYANGLEDTQVSHFPTKKIRKLEAPI
jgi:hypothetical protein